MRFGWLVAAALFVASGGVRAAEVEFRHINDLFSVSRNEDDLYTATIGVAGTVKGWTIDLDEYLFTDRANRLRFDETYLTVARGLLRPDSRWSVQARTGASRVGRGIHGQRLQNFVHRVLAQDKVNLPYVRGVRSYVFLRVNVSRTMVRRSRSTLTTLLEVESAGFKGHVRAAVAAGWDLGRGFELRAEGGARFTDSDFPPLVPWIQEADSTVALGVTYKGFVDLTWTRNYFGTGDNHWRVTARLHF